MDGAQAEPAPAPTESPEAIVNRIAALPKQQILEGLRELARANQWAEFGVVLHCLPKGTRVRINMELIS